jgi:two-component system sensor histidine kinase ChvG
MALATDIANPDRLTRWRRRGRRFLPGSRLGQLIIGLNLLGLAILIGGALLLNELRRGLVNARIDSLSTQGEFIANVIDRAATRGEPAPLLETERAAETLQLLFIPHSQRARLFDAKGQLIADSYVAADRVERRTLPPARRPGDPPPRPPSLNAKPGAEQAARTALAREVAIAMKGQLVAGMRMGANGQRVVSVSIPLRHVEAVLGVLTLEAGDVDQIIAAERRALMPFILMAIAVSLTSSFFLIRMIAQPVRRLARAADRVRLSRARAISLPDLSVRHDELGDLSRALEAMTAAQSERMDAIERFAADVAHEIRNPLTSIRSATETLDLVPDPKSRARLMAILKQDVSRLDRLITDISNASRLDAELSRDPPRPIDMNLLIGELVRLYAEAASPGAVAIHYQPPESLEPLMISGREGPLSQVLRNLVDNARSFARLGRLGDEGQVRVRALKAGAQVLITVEDDGPGIPPENLETVFERFYTARPKGAAFGGNSGLGLSIARQIIEAHGGKIWAENSGEGARFCLSFPDLKP